MDYENLKTIEINDKEYRVLVCETDEDRQIGLSQTSELNSDEGCLFLFPTSIQASECVFTCSNMSFDIDIIYVSDDTVVSVMPGKVGDAEIIPDCDPEIKIDYVIELNANSGIKVGDEVDIDNEEVLEEEVEKLYILGPDGQPQGIISSGSRIFSRVDSRNLIKKAKKANKTKSDSDYKKLGKLVFNIMHKHDVQEPEYVESPK